MKIRFAKPKDKQQVLKLLDEFSQLACQIDDRVVPDGDAQNSGGPIFDEIISRSNAMIFVAEDEDKIVALATFYLLPNIRHGWHRGHIEDFIVSESSRGKGIGSRLMSAIKEYCKENNIKVMKVTTRTDNINAQSFYQKNGGKHTEILYRYDIE